MESAVFSLSSIFTHASSDEEIYESSIISAIWQPGDIFRLHLLMPYVWNSGEDRATSTKCEAHGIGDVRVIAWAGMTKRRTSKERHSEKRTQESTSGDPFAESENTAPAPQNHQKSSYTTDTRPHLWLGLGAKLPTGSCDLQDSSGTLLPSRFQPGWGVISPIMGLSCHQNLTNIRLAATVTCEVSGGENSVEYKHSSILRADSAFYYPLSNNTFLGGLGYSLTWIPDEDRQAGVKVEDTDGTFHFANVTGVFTPCRSITALFSVKVLLHSSQSYSEDNIRVKYTLSFTYAF